MQRDAAIREIVELLETAATYFELGVPQYAEESVTLALVVAKGQKDGQTSVD